MGLLIKNTNLKLKLKTRLETNKEQLVTIGISNIIFKIEIELGVSFYLSHVSDYQLLLSSVRGVNMLLNQFRL